MVLGIDLGTTYSAAAYVDKDNEIKMIVNAEGDNITPSVVFEENKGNIIVGNIAKENAVIRPNDVVSVVKNHMGTKDTFTLSSGNVYTPEQISSFIIRKMVKDAEKFSGETIKDVIITVPAYFTEAQRTATKDAAKLAGVNMLGSINEPTAAMLGYVKRKDIKKGIFMIYDLGGGTFDVSIVKVENDDISVIGTGGIMNAGGHFFDLEIVKYVSSYLYDKYQIDIEADEYKDEYQEIVNKAENAKIQLSARDTTSIVVKIDKVRESIEITREFFESKIKRTYKNTEAKMKSALRDAGVTVADIDTVLMVGGSSRIPYIKKCVRDFIGQEPATDINPDEAVAMGAALYGNIKGANSEQKVFHDTNSHSIGMVFINKTTGTKENRILIRKSVGLPAEGVIDKLATMIPNQEKIVMPITEGESTDIDAVALIDEMEIDLPKGLPVKTNVVVKFMLDENQILHVYLNIPSIPNFNYEQKINRRANLTDEELSTMLGFVADIDVN